MEYERDIQLGFDGCRRSSLSFGAVYNSDRLGTVKYTAAAVYTGAMLMDDCDQITNSLPSYRAGGGGGGGNAPTLWPTPGGNECNFAGSSRAIRLSYADSSWASRLFADQFPTAAAPREQPLTAERSPSKSDCPRP